MALLLKQSCLVLCNGIIQPKKHCHSCVEKRKHSSSVFFFSQIENAVVVSFVSNWEKSHFANCSFILLVLIDVLVDSAIFNCLCSLQAESQHDPAKGERHKTWRRALWSGVLPQTAQRRRSKWFLNTSNVNEKYLNFLWENSKNVNEVLMF